MNIVIDVDVNIDIDIDIDNIYTDAYTVNSLHAYLIKKSSRKITNSAKIKNNWVKVPKSAEKCQKGGIS